jgi:multiple sugar transport system substrate-binding protein
MGKFVKWSVVGFLIALSLSSCGSVSSNNISSPNQAAESSARSDSVMAAAVDSSPVDLVMYSSWLLSQRELDNRFLQPLSKKYPNIHLNIVQPAKGNDLQSLIGAGQQFDVATGPAMYLSKFGDLGMFGDMTSLIKSHQFDMNRIHPEVMKAIQSYGKKGDIFGLPYSIIGYALYYNKDIFDKFGLTYPKDQMSWEQMIALAQKLSRSTDGVQYKGLMFQDINNLASMLSLDYVDPKTGKAAVNNDGWKKGFELMRSIVTIPGNQPIKQEARFFDWKQEFATNKNVAMMAHISSLILNFSDLKDLNWDMVTYPTFPEKPGTWGQPDGQAIMVVPGSKHKDAAFQVIETLLSDEVQTTMSKWGDMPAIQSKAAEDVYGQSLAQSSDKNVKALFLNKPAPWRNVSKYDQEAATMMATHSRDVYQGKDINTILREAQEDMDKYLETNK